MNIRPFHSPGWHDETTLPLPLLGVEHQREFAPTQAAVHEVCGVCAGRCPTPQACELAEARQQQARSLARLKRWAWVLVPALVAILGALYRVGGCNG